VGDVLNEGQDLRHRDSEAHNHRREHDAQSDQPTLQRFWTRFTERQIQREQCRRDQQVVRGLHVRAQETKRDGDGEQRVAPGAFVPQRREKREEGERQHRRDEQLAVVTRMHV